MSLLLKVVAEGIDPVMASFELGLCDMAEQDRIARGSAEICCLTMVAGGSLCSGSAWSQATTPSKEKTQGKLAVPVSTFIRKNGVLLQPIEITLDNHGSGGVAVTRVASEEVDRRMV